MSTTNIHDDKLLQQPHKKITSFQKFIKGYLKFSYNPNAHLISAVYIFLRRII
jgi:hypothetical protein